MYSNVKCLLCLEISSEKKQYVANHRHHRHHAAVIGLGHLLAHSGLAHPEVSSMVFSDFISLWCVVFIKFKTKSFFLLTNTQKLNY